MGNAPQRIADLKVIEGSKTWEKNSTRRYSNYEQNKMTHWNSAIWAQLMTPVVAIELAEKSEDVPRLSWCLIIF